MRPLLILGLAATNEWHGLIWPAITPISTEPGTRLIYSHGIFFWVHAAFAYTMMILGTYGLVRTALRTIISDRSHQHAIDACHAAGGGRVNVPAGKTCLIGTLTLKSNSKRRIPTNGT